MIFADTSVSAQQSKVSKSRERFPAPRFLGMEVCFG